MVPGFDPHLEQLSFVIIELSDDCQHIHISHSNSRKRHLMGIPQFHHELCRSGVEHKDDSKLDWNHQERHWHSKDKDDSKLD